MPPTTGYASFLQLNVLRSSLPHMLEVFLLGNSKLTMSPQGPFPRFQVLMFRRPLGNTEELGVHQKLCCRHQEDKSSCNLNKCAIDGSDMQVAFCTVNTCILFVFTLCVTIRTMSFFFFSFVCLLACFCFFCLRESLSHLMFWSPMTIIPHC